MHEGSKSRKHKQDADVCCYNDQLLSQLKLTDRRPGFLLNFGMALTKDGMKRIVL